MCPSVSSCAESFSDSASGGIITFHDPKRSFEDVESRQLRRDEKLLYPGRIRKCSKPSCIVKYHVDQWKDVARRQE